MSFRHDRCRFCGDTGVVVRYSTDSRYEPVWEPCFCKVRNTPGPVVSEQKPTQHSLAWRAYNLLHWWSDLSYGQHKEPGDFNLISETDALMGEILEMEISARGGKGTGAYCTTCNRMVEPCTYDRPGLCLNYQDSDQ